MTAPRLSTGHAFSRRDATNTAIQAAMTVRQKVGAQFHVPICIYDVCHALGVTVRFNDISTMEGMYQKRPKPQIHLPAKRPLPRRAFSCGHELGHHEFGHGASIDQMQLAADQPTWKDSKEFLADSFAAHLLMPVIGLRGSFNSRAWSPETSSPEELYVIACDFGVGYKTLVTYLSTGLGLMSQSRAATMKRHTPKSIRSSLLGTESSTPLIIASSKRLNPRIDMEVGHQLLLPKDTVVDADKLTPIRQLKNASLFVVTKPGIAQIRSPEWSAFVRIAREEYVGLARYRHLEDDYNDE